MEIGVDFGPALFSHVGHQQIVVTVAVKETTTSVFRDFSIIFVFNRQKIAVKFLHFSSCFVLQDHSKKVVENCRRKVRHPSKYYNFHLQPIRRNLTLAYISA